MLKEEMTGYQMQPPHLLLLSSAVCSWQFDFCLLHRTARYTGRLPTVLPSSALYTKVLPCHLIIISPVAVLHLPEIGYSNLPISEITYPLGPPARRPQVPKNSDAYHLGVHATFLRI